MELDIELRPGQHSNVIEKLDQLYHYLAGYQLTNHVPPTRQLMRREMNIGGTALDSYLKMLEERGYVKCSGFGWWTVEGIEYTDRRQWQTTTT